MGIRELLSTRDKREARDRDDGTSVERGREVMGRKRRERESLLNPVSKLCENARKCESRPDSENGGVSVGDEAPL